MIEGVFGREAETVAFAFLAWRRRLPLWKHVLGNIWWRQATSRTVPSSSPWLLRCAFACCFRSNPMQHRHRLRRLRAHRKRRRRRQHPPPAAPIRPGQARPCARGTDDASCMQAAVEREPNAGWTTFSDSLRGLISRQRQTNSGPSPTAFLVGPFRPRSATG